MKKEEEQKEKYLDTDDDADDDDAYREIGEEFGAVSSLCGRGQVSQKRDSLMKRELPSPSLHRSRRKEKL